MTVIVVYLVLSKARALSYAPVGSSLPPQAATRPAVEIAAMDAASARRWNGLCMNVSCAGGAG
ncbi:MAG: hypothetical protein QM777_14720 [Pseudorhodoferax sp.]